MRFFDKYVLGHNPYFNRWFSAIQIDKILKYLCEFSHNPYFNRWFSAIPLKEVVLRSIKKVTILILIDGFLQFVQIYTSQWNQMSHNPYFNRWFSAIWVSCGCSTSTTSSQSLF